MNIYPILVFFHVVGGVGIFVMLGVEAVVLSMLRRAATPAEARASMRVAGSLRRAGPVAMLMMLASGIWMTAKWWGPTPWIEVALVAVVAMAVLGGGVSGRRMRGLGQALASETELELSDGFRSLRASRALTTSLRVRIATGVGILGLMTLKPGAAVSLILMGAALAAGLIASVRPARAAEAQSVLQLKRVRA